MVLFLLNIGRRCYCLLNLFFNSLMLLLMINDLAVGYLEEVAWGSLIMW